MYKDSGYKANYDFVPKSKRRKYECCKKNYSGHIDIEISVCSPLHIGTGSKSFIGGGDALVREAVKYDGIPVIPGSSFKGAIRHIAEAVSDSCISNTAVPKDERCMKNDRCIVCDMFGMMGRGSKVIFPDFKSDNADAGMLECNGQFSPRICKDGCYKFYKTEQEEYTLEKRIMVEAVKKGAVFSETIYFRSLSEEQLSLLMFSMGLDKDKPLMLKLGGHKNEGFGNVSVKALGFECKGIDKTPAALAAQYTAMNSASSEAIEKLQKILKRQSEEKQ